MEPGQESIDEPLFQEVRRRHPEVDIVLVPPEPRPAEPEEHADDIAADALIRVDTQARRLWSAIAPGASERPDSRFRFGDGPGSVRPVSELAVRRDDGYEVLVRLRHELESHGWEIRRPDGTVEQLAGGLDGHAVSASYAAALGVLVFTMKGPSVTVGVHRARELTASGRRR